ncbi:hypothetical protein KAZ93_04300 [Patescibacteria group bacterium]|nr:hypothetical protein [Patescibacteria group bacterium]
MIPQTKKDHPRRYEFYAGAIFLIGICTSIYGLRLLYQTWISGWILLIVFILGGMIVRAIHRRCTRQYRIKISEHIALGCGYAMITATLFLGLNTRYADPITISEQSYPIIDKRTQRSNGYKTKKVLEYFVSIAHEGESITLKFPESDSTELDRSDAVWIVSRV